LSSLKRERDEGSFYSGGWDCILRGGGCLFLRGRGGGGTLIYMEQLLWERTGSFFERSYTQFGKKARPTPIGGKSKNFVHPCSPGKNALSSGNEGGGCIVARDGASFIGGRGGK